MTTPQPAALPELPHTTYSLFYEQPGDLEDEGYQYVLDEPGYTADQMRAYALAALQSQPAAAPLPPASPATKGYCNDERCCQNCFSGQGACLFPLPEQPAAAGVSDAEIDTVIRQQRLAGWFTFSDDLRPFARAILALRPQAVPMTPDQLADKCEAWIQGGGASNIVDAFEAGYRLCEHDHGITAQGAQGEQA